MDAMWQAQRSGSRRQRPAAAAASQLAVREQLTTQSRSFGKLQVTARMMLRSTEEVFAASLITANKINVPKTAARERIVNSMSEIKDGTSRLDQDAKE